MNERVRGRASSVESTSEPESVAPPSLAPTRPVTTGSPKKARAPDAVDYVIVVCPFCNGSQTSVVPKGENTEGPGWRYRQCNNGCVEKKNGVQRPRWFKENLNRATTQA